jgi:hypothetical protein
MPTRIEAGFLHRSRSESLLLRVEIGFALLNSLRLGAFARVNSSESCYNRTMMTADEYLKKMQDPLWYGEQDENGVDLSLIRSILELTPEQRLLQGDQGRFSALELRKYGELHRANELRLKSIQEQSSQNR